MKLGYFLNPANLTILVVNDFENWTANILKEGFSTTPAITREATTPEREAFALMGDRFPAWQYANYDELIDDEIKSGAAHHHLSDLVAIMMERLNREEVSQHRVAV